MLTTPAEPKISPLPTPGAYSVVGRVELNGEDQVFYIDVDGLSFTLDRADTAGQIPRTGEWVSFNLHGLSLWDENI